MLEKLVFEITSLFDSKGAKDASNYISSLKSSITSLSAVSIATAYSVDKLFNSFSNNFSEIYRNTEMFGENIESIQSYINVASKNLYSSKEEATSDINNIYDTIRKIKMEGSVPIGFTLAGVNINNSIPEILEQFRDVFQGLDEKQGRNLAEKSGLQNLYPILKLTREEFKKLNDTPILTKEQIESGLETSKIIKSIKTEIIAFKNIALADLSSYFNEALIEGLKWIKENQFGVINLMKNTVRVTGDLTVAFSHIVAGISDVVSYLTKSKLGTFGLTSALLLLGATLKPTWILFTSIVIALDDLYVYLKGGKSIIGSFVKELGSVKTTAILGGIGLITTAIFSMNSAILTTTGSLGVLLNGILKVSKIGGAIGTVVAVKEAIQETKEGTGQRGIKNILSKTAQGTILGASLGGVSGAVIGGASGLGTSIYQNYLSKKNNEKEKNNVSENNKEINNTFNINVDATTKEGARDIAEEMKKQLSGMIRNSLVGNLK